MDEGLARLIWDVLGEEVSLIGEAFNVHYASSSAFIKVTRPWVRSERAQNEVLAATAMAKMGVPVALPLIPDVLAYRDEQDRERYVTVWERLLPGRALSEAEALEASAEWIWTIFNLQAPTGLTQCFRLDDFLHAAHLRLDGSRHPLASRVLAAVEAASKQDGYRHPACAGLIHGDLHPQNLFSSDRGLRIIDWESSCSGPIEWDAAQNLRYTPEAGEEARLAYWAERGLDLDLIEFYRHVRSLTSLSHMIAAGIRPPMYYRAVQYLGYEIV